MPQRHFSIVLWIFRVAVVIAVLLVESGACLAGEAIGEGASGDRAMTIAVAVTQPTCEYNNGSFVVKATGGTPPYSYLSSVSPQSNTNGVFAGLGPGTYSITATDATGLTATSSVSLTNSNQPAPYTWTTTNPTGCFTNDGTITITPEAGLGPYAYSIDCGVTFQSSNVLTGLGPGTYNVFVRDASGCIWCPWSTTSTSYADLQYFGLATSIKLTSPNCAVQLNVTPSVPKCANIDYFLVTGPAGGMLPYSYSLDGTPFQQLPQNSFYNLAPGDHTLVVKDAAGKENSYTYYFPSNCPVTATVQGAACGVSGGSLTVSGGNGVQPFTYSIDGETFQSSNTFDGLTAGTYTIIVKDTYGATNTVSASVTGGCLVLGTNTMTATCGKANGTLTVGVSSGTQPYQYSLNGVNFQPQDFFPNLAGGNYTITVKDAGGKEATTAVTIGDIPGAQVTANVQPASCLNDDGTVTINTSGGTTPFLYSINGGSFGSAATFSALAAGPQTVTVKDDNDCVTSAAVTVPLDNDLSLTIGAGVNVCDGSTVTLPVVCNANSFAWIPAGGLSDPAIADPVADPPTTTTYELTATLGVCTQTGQVTVSILPVPTADAGTSDSICYGKSTQLQGSGGVRYQWSPVTYLSDPTSANPMVQQPATSITYSLTVFGANGCASVQPATVGVAVTAPAIVFAGDDTAVLIGQPLPLEAIDVNNSGFTSYQWTPVSGLSDPSSQDPTALITGNITYMVTATTAAGCTGSGSIGIDAFAFSDIIVPKAFTPNHDGHNDVLRAIAMGIRDFRNFEVYNRWGQQVFSTSNPGIGWDGTVGGHVASAGTYVWIASGLDFQGRVIQRRGTVILIR